MFERFYEGEYRKFHTIGTGIGLSLTKDLVLLHHGTIQVFSDKEEGNTFVVEIPIRREAFDEDEVDENTENVDYAILSADEMENVSEIDMLEEKPAASTILLVEDNEELLALMVRLLHGKYHILKAANGTEALEILAKQEVDLIVSDVMMPEMDGMELCRRVKTQFETCHIPLILLTAKTSDEDRVEGYESGADGYICKPLRLSVLFAKIDNLLKRRKRMGVDFRKQLVFEAKELNYTSMDEAFIRKAVDCVNAHLSDCDFEHAQFMAEMGMARTTLADKLKLLTGLTPSAFISNVRLQAACRLIDEKKKIRSESVQFQNVHLRISSTFRNNIKKKMTLERVHSTTKKSKKVVETTEETRKAELELFLKQNVCINKNEYIQLSGLTRHAAIDELNNFIRQGFLRRRGMGRSTVYVRQEKDTANEI